MVGALAGLIIDRITETTVVPAGFDVITTLHRRGGHIELYHHAGSTTVLAVAHGWIGPRLLCDELSVLRDLPIGPDGWTYVVDTGGVRFANPLNIVVLRRLASLPGLNGYRVVAPRLPIRTALRILRRFVGADEIDVDLPTALQRFGVR